jgi:signal transduction histidine kinase/ActR/RegA family two-component response regulator
MARDREQQKGDLLVLAPTGEDATVIARVLSSRSFDTRIVASLTEVCELLRNEEGLSVSGLVVTEEALEGEAAVLIKCLEDQAAWSDLPTCVLIVAGNPDSAAVRWRFFEALGNVTLLARPLTVEALLSAARGLLRARARQLQTKRHLDELKAAALMLEQRVAQRTEELMAVEQTLRQAQKMEAIGQLTGGIAHDFNNLLQVISSNMELIKVRIRQGRMVEIERHAQSATEATQRAAALTHRLLAFSRRQTLHPKPVDANQLVSDMLELLQRTLGPSISVNTAFAHDLHLALCDPPQLENVVLNLCINARDAMPEGGELRLMTENSKLRGRATVLHDLPEGDYVVLSVTDTGCGMTPEIAAKAFDPFFTTKPIGQGTGLGLSMVYGFTRQSGGKVTIDSRVGAGTTVSIYLPKLEGDDFPVAIKSQAPTAPLVASPKTVLVIDDESAVRTLCAEVLREAGYNVIEAGDGLAGLSLLESNLHFDMLVTDIGMPGINGREMADRARRTRPELRVLYITGYAEKAAFPNGNVDPGSHLLTKPFAIQDLLARVEQIIAAEKS